MCMTLQSSKINLLGRCAHSLNIFKGLTKFFFYLYERRGQRAESAILISFRSADLLRIPFCSPAAPVIFQHTLFYIPISMSNYRMTK